jgi:hypothetical protein
VHFLGNQPQEWGGFVDAQPTERNRIPMSHEARHNSTVLECSITRAWSGPNHPHAGDQIGFYSALAIPEFTPSISAPKSLPSVPLFL